MIDCVIDWMLTWSTTVLAISTAIMAGAIAITAGYAIVQLIHAKKARYSSLLMQLHQIWQSNEYIEARTMMNRYCTGISLEDAAKAITKSLKRLDETNVKKYFVIIRPAEYFENLGFLACNGHLEGKQAIELFGDAAARYWKLYKGFAEYKQKHDPLSKRMWVNFEYLALGCPKDILKRNKCLSHM
jgi:hypothetical protein